MWEWKNADLAERRPPPLVIEIYLDTAELSTREALVAIDEHGARWNVMDALNALAVPAAQPLGNIKSKKTSEITIERWSIELGDPKLIPKSELKDTLPNVYKKAVVLFKSLYTYVKLLPAWRFWRGIIKQPRTNNALRPCYRILHGDLKSQEKDTLDMPLWETSEPVVSSFGFASTNTPAGPFYIRVDYRSRCEFRVDDAEALLSSQMMAMDHHHFEPSLNDRIGSEPRFTSISREPGSLPTSSKGYKDIAELGQAYGSMSTFHQAGLAAGTSPISALRAARETASPSPRHTPPQRFPSSPRAVHGFKSSLRSGDAAPSFARRPSVSFKPFKAGSLSSSPAPAGQASPLGETVASQSPQSTGQSRNSALVTAFDQQAERTPSLPNETVVASSASGSPKPALVARYSSSFGNRKTRFSSGTGSKTEDDVSSSGKGSLSSFSQKGSGVLPGGYVSSGSVHGDDDNISDFLKLLEQKKDLKSFNCSDSASRDASTKRTTAALSKYQRMRDSNTHLSESMSSSSHLLQRSSSSSSRQLSQVPPMIPGTSLSTSSSPGKPISPHTPHTPAIPSRLSANSIIEYGDPRGNGIGNRDPPRTGEVQSPAIISRAAIDIPASPRQYQFPRRSSSVRRQQRLLDEEANQLPFGARSASLPLEDRPELSLSELLHSNEAQVGTSGGMPGLESQDQSGISRQPSSSFGSREAGAVFRSRFARGSGRGLGSMNASNSSLAGTGSGTSNESNRARLRAPAFEDEEPLLFAMSDFHTSGSGRRSIEDGPAGNATEGNSDRGGFNARTSGSGSKI